MRLWAAGFALLATATFTSSWAQMASPDPHKLPDPFQAPQRQWARLADGKPWGTTAGIEIGPHGEIWAIDRCGDGSCDGSAMAAVHQLDPKTGRPLRSIGQGLFAMPHGLHVDKDGNVWVTDAAVAKKGGAPKGEQVIKMSPDGKVLMALGTAGVSGGGPTHFHDPGDVITAPDGDIFVADGHGTVAMDLPPDTITRIIKFTPDGKFIKSWGSLGSGKSQFRNPHALAFDSQGRLLVADRVNGRIQVFDQNGKWLTEYRQFNHPSGLYMAPHDVLYASDYNSDGQKGVYIGSARTGTLRAFVPDDQAGEGVALGPDGTLYEATPTGITRFLPKP
jgi:sugar lactone lactonase YvrE